MGPGWDTVILGSGPVGLTAALIAARSGRVLVIMPRRATGAAPLRIDCVPAALLAMFIELGLHPAKLGASAIHTHRLVAWSGATPEVTRAAATVHILRPKLERGLLVIARAHRNIGFVIGATLETLPSATLVLDATGRRAVTAERRYFPVNPAILFSVIARGAFSRAQQAFRMASLPTGYAYRLGISEFLMVGLVEGRDQSRSSNGTVPERLRRLGAGWLLDGMPSGFSTPARGGVASVQWTSGSGPVVRIGDAAFARDALASQGIANGISGALCLFEAADAGNAYIRRTNGEIVSHVATLQRLVADCAYRDHAFWAHYAGFLVRARGSVPTPLDLGIVPRRPNVTSI